jgi:hypothetical protein
MVKHKSKWKQRFEEDGIKCGFIVAYPRYDIAKVQADNFSKRTGLPTKIIRC